MKTDKTKLLQDIEAMKEKLASMEEELNKPEVFKHFPSKDDLYFYYTPMGTVCSNIATNDNLKINVFKSEEEADKAYRKEVALEKVKRRIIELQGDWKPDWSDSDEPKVCISYLHYSGIFQIDLFYFGQSSIELPYMKTSKIAETIIEEMEDELKLIFDIA